MIRKFLFTILFICTLAPVFAQTYMTRNGNARFYSKTDLEDIAAENKQVMAIIDPATGSVAVSMLMRGFLFKKDLMQDHFNENYVESDRFPKASFEGSFSEAIDLAKTGPVSLAVKGKLTMHGVTRPVEIPLNLNIQEGSISGTASFQLVPEDFDIKIPAIVREKIAQKIDVRISLDCKKQN